MFAYKNQFSLYSSFIFFGAILLTTFSCEAVEQGNVQLSGTARFTVVSDDCIRIEYSPDRIFINEPSWFAKNRNLNYKDFYVSKKDGVLKIETPKLLLKYSDNGKSFSKENLEVRFKTFKGSWHPGKENKGNLGGTVTTLDGVHSPIYLGEGLLSTDGWYLLDDSDSTLFSGDWLKERPEGAGSDWYLFAYGKDFKQALKTFAQISEPVPIPRRYLLGSWYSRWFKYSSDDYKNIIKEYNENEVPLDIIVMDMDWHLKGWTGWTWNQELITKPKELMEYFDNNDLATVLNLHPADGVKPHEDKYPAFMKAMGEDPVSQAVLPFDAGSKKYLESLFNEVITPLEDDGVDFWWLDWQQYPFTQSLPKLTNLSSLNRYFFEHTAKSGRRGASFSRWAGWGDHRYPVHFSGDAHTGWDMLEFEVPFTSVAGNVGAFYWSHDIGGFHGPRIPEAYARWAQFGAFSPAFRIHSSWLANLDKRPWTWPQDIEDSVTKSLRLRAKIFPYIYSSAYQGYTDALPLSRPMYLMYSENKESYKNPQEYMFGEHMLVAPIVRPGVSDAMIGKQVVWFPEGTWYNWFTGEKYKGNSEHLLVGDIHEFPVFVKAGAPIPLSEEKLRMASDKMETVRIRLFYPEKGKEESLLLYEDDGASQDYMSGKYATSKITTSLKYGKVSVKIEPLKLLEEYQPTFRKYIIELAGSNKADKVEASNDSIAKTNFDTELGMNVIELKPVKIGDKLTVMIDAEAFDSKAQHEKIFKRRLKRILPEGNKSLSYEEAIAYCDDSAQTELKEMIIALKGIGFGYKHETGYIYATPRSTYFYNGTEGKENFDIRLEKRTLKNKKSDRNEVLSFVNNISNRTLLTSKTFHPNLDSIIRYVAIAENKTFGQLESLLDVTYPTLNDYQVVGPFPFDSEKGIKGNVYAPETITNHSVSVKTKDGSGIQWEKAEVDQTGKLNFIHLWGEKDSYKKIAYAYHSLVSPKAQDYTFLVQSDDGVEVFLNGKKIHSKNVLRSVDSEADKIKTLLNEGQNHLLFKVSNDGGDWGLRVKLLTEDPATSNQRPLTSDL